MSEAPEPDLRPWRKRRPVLSRVVLFGVGGGVIALLLVLYNQRQEEDRLTELRGVVQAFDLLLTIESGPDQVLRQIDAELGDPDLPLDLRVAAQRFTAMALRQKARRGTAGAEVGERINAAFGAALELVADRDTRNGLLLEWSEAYLEQGDVEGARSVLARGDFGGDGPWALLQDHYLALAEALELGAEAGARRLEQILEGWEPPLPLEPRVDAGARRWNLPQVATVTTERLARIYTGLGRDPKPLWERLSLLVANDAREQVICVKSLMALGARQEAAEAWRRAIRADAAEAARWQENDRSLQALTQALQN